MLFFNNFRSWLRFGFIGPLVTWVEVFVTKASGLQLQVVATKDLVLDVVGVLYPLLFTYVC